MAENNQLVMISGLSGTGKSASLRNIRNQENWLYLNCEAGKRLPFRNKFPSKYVITDPYQVTEAFDYGTGNPDVAGIVVDTATFMMDLFESVHIIGSANTMQGWANYQQFWKDLMQQRVTAFQKPTLFLAHTKEVLDQEAGIMRSSVPVKGALANQGLEAYFSVVVSTKKVPIRELEKYQNDLLHINDEDTLVGFKHVFQTRITKNTTGERIRAPLDMFSVKETYIDNDAQLLLDHLNKFYA